jgi:hypothetical protein
MGAGAPTRPGHRSRIEELRGVEGSPRVVEQRHAQLARTPQVEIPLREPRRLPDLSGPGDQAAVGVEDPDYRPGRDLDRGEMREQFRARQLGRGLLEPFEVILHVGRSAIDELPRQLLHRAARAPEVGAENPGGEQENGEPLSEEESIAKRLDAQDGGSEREQAYRAPDVMARRRSAHRSAAPSRPSDAGRS